VKLPKGLEGRVLELAREGRLSETVARLQGKSAARHGHRLTADATTVTEKEFQAAVIKLAKLYGWATYHTHDSRRSVKGFPDLALCHPGRRLLVFAELKNARGRLTSAQEFWIMALRMAGVRTYVWTPHQWAEVVRVLSE
jgi:hypothetical protein